MKVMLPQENTSLVFTTFHNTQDVQRVYLASETYFAIIKIPIFGSSEWLELTYLLGINIIT